MTRASVRTLRIAALAAFLGGVARPAAADWQFTPFFGWTFKGSTTLREIEIGSAESVHWNFGGTVTLVGRGPIGVEGLFVYVPGFFTGGNWLPPVTPGQGPGVNSSHVYALMGNVVLIAPKSWNEYGLRPYLSGGLGLLNATQVDQGGVFTFRQNIPAYNLGGGATGFLTDHTGLRFDLRYVANLHNQDDPLALDPVTGLNVRKLHYWNLSIGVVFRY